MYNVYMPGVIYYPCAGGHRPEGEVPDIAQVGMTYNINTA